MLVLSRREQESIIITGPCKVTVVGILGTKVKIGIDAEKHVEIFREEIWEQIKQKEAACQKQPQ